MRKTGTHKLALAVFILVFGAQSAAFAQKNTASGDQPVFMNNSMGGSSGSSSSSPFLFGRGQTSSKGQSFDELMKASNETMIKNANAAASMRQADLVEDIKQRRAEMDRMGQESGQAGKDTQGHDAVKPDDSNTVMRYQPADDSKPGKPPRLFNMP